MGPEYRVMNRYVKSTKQYWKERNRRKRARELESQGFTYKQIAKRLGVSEKTVQRDMKKNRRYYIGKINRAYRLLEEERKRKLDRELEGKSLSQQYKIMSRRIDAYMKRVKLRKYLRHLFVITIDMTKLDHGLPKLKFSPSKSFSVNFSEPFHVRILAKTEEFEAPLGGFTIGGTTTYPHRQYG